MHPDIDTMVRGYLECAIWTFEEDLFRDWTFRDWTIDFHPSNFDSKSQDKARSECAVMLDQMLEAGFDMNDCDLSNVGHDFWLTRNRHGTGFWDRPSTYGVLRAQKYSELAHAFKECWVIGYRGKDGSVWLELSP